MKRIKLHKGAHPAPFDEQGNATMCVMEYISYLAGEPHSDEPNCVSPVLAAFTIKLNDTLDDEERQRLRPYAVRQLGTQGDSQDEARRLLALDWIIRVHTPAFLAAAGLTEAADRLVGLAAIEGLESATAAAPHVNAAREAALATSSGATWESTWAAQEVAWATGCGATWEAAWAARNTNGDWEAAARDEATWKAASGAAWAARNAAWEAASGAAWTADSAADWDTASGALRTTIEMLRESMFRLLDKMTDPGGIHNIDTEEMCFARTGREALI